MPYLPSVTFLADSIGAGEWIVLFVVILIVVGPKRLPDIARKIGRTMEMFRRAADEFKEQLMSMDQPPPTTPSSASTLPPADADGVPKSNTSADSSPTTSGDAYPNVASYPGNENHIENRPIETSSSEQLAHGGAPSEIGVPKGTDAGVASEPKDKSAEGGA